MDINDLTKHATKLLNLTTDGWERSIYFDLSKLTEETGEVAECLNKSKFTDEDLGDELADVMTVVAVIALKRDIDLNKALSRKHKKQIQKIIKRNATVKE